MHSLTQPMLRPDQIDKIFSRLQALNPTPTTELHYQSAFELLIAVMLSAQATDIAVNKVTQSLFKRANTPEKMLDLGLAELKNAIKTIGLFNNKATYILKTCQYLIEKYHSEVPAYRSALEMLPGVGRKTANVILNTYFGQPTLAVDTHIFRVANRLGLAHGSTVQQIERQLLSVIPTQYLLNAHHWLLLHGRYTCLARKPRCAQCPVNDICQYTHKLV